MREVAPPDNLRVAAGLPQPVQWGHQLLHSGVEQA